MKLVHIVIIFGFIHFSFALKNISWPSEPGLVSASPLFQKGACSTIVDIHQSATDAAQPKAKIEMS